MNVLKNQLTEQKRSILWLLLSSAITGAAVIGQAYFFVATVDAVFLKGASFSDVLPLLAGLLLVQFGRTVANYVSGRIGVSMAAKAKGDFRKSLLNKFSRAPVEASLKGQSGKKVSVMMDAVDEVDGYFSSYIPQVIKTTFIPLSVLITVFTQHLNTGLIMIVTAPFIPIFMIIIGMQTQKKSEEQLDKLASFSGKFLDSLQGLTTLKLFGRARQQEKEIETSSLGFRDATMKILKTAFTQSFMLEVITMLSIGIIALELAIQLIIYESISFFTAFLVFVLVPEFYTFLKELGSAFHNGRSSMGAAKKIQNALDETEQPVQWGTTSLPKTKIPPRITLHEAGFHYGEGAFVLHPMAIEISPFSQIAIVGPSGSGKSTILHLLAGLLEPTEGGIDVNGSSRSDYREKDWFNNLSYISQHPYLFSGTIAENIAIGGNTEASRGEVKQAAEQAGISGMIEALAYGYDTPVGEAGRGLSGGEKQRLAIARAFLKKPSVVLFDEPTTGLDLQTEQILKASIQQLAQEATVITVAHRLHTIKDADRILFLDNGTLIASGKHEDLLRTVPTYRNMVTAQQGGTAQ